MKTVNIGLLVGIAVLAMVGLSFFAFWGTSMGASKYVTFPEAKVSGEDVHVVGNWVMEDRSSYNREKDLFTFYMQDTLKNVSLVNYYNPMPANFKTTERFAIQGKYEGNIFVADEIIMKCPSKYNEGAPSKETASAESR